MAHSTNITVHIWGLIILCRLICHIYKPSKIRATWPWHSVLLSILFCVIPNKIYQILPNSSFLQNFKFWKPFEWLQSYSWLHIGTQDNKIWQRTWSFYVVGPFTLPFCYLNSWIQILYGSCFCLERKGYRRWGVFFCHEKKEYPGGFFCCERKE